MKVTALALLAFLANACIPFASPPVRLNYGGGGGIGRIATGQEKLPEEVTSDEFVTIRGSVNPLDIFPSLIGRSFDFGLGYMGEFFSPYGDHQYIKHGPFVRMSYYPLAGFLFSNSKSSVYRLGVEADLELVLGEVVSGYDCGPGLTLTTSFELATFYRGTFSLHARPHLGGYAYGELSIGLFASVGYRYIHDRHYAVFYGGLFFRLPMSAGILFIY